MESHIHSEVRMTLKLNKLEKDYKGIVYYANISP